MKDESKTKRQLIHELNGLRERLAALERSHPQAFGEGLPLTDPPWQRLVEQLPAVTYVARPDSSGRLLYISPQVESILGYPAEEMRRKQGLWLQRIHPQDRERVGAEVERALRSREPFVCAYRMVARDGRLVWLRDHGVLVSDAEGKPLYVCGVALDITAHKQAEQARQDSERRYRLIFEQMLSALAIFEAVHDEHGRTVDLQLVDMNAACEELLGRKREALIGKRARELIPGMSGVSFFSYIHVVETGIPLHVERFVPDLNRHLEVLAYRPEEGRLTVVANDITERQQMLDALQGSEARYRLLLNGLPVGFALFEAIPDDGGGWTDFRLLEANPAFEQLTGMKLDRALGRKLSELFPDVLEGGHLESCVEVARTGRPLQIEISAADPGRRFEARAYCPRYGQFAMTFTDLTEEKLAADRLRREHDLVRSILDACPDGIVIADMNAEIVDCNRAAGELLGGGAPANLVGRKVYDFIDPATCPFVFDADGRQADEGRARRLDCVVTTLDGRRIPIEMSIGLVVDGTGRPVRFVGVFSDVSGRRAADQALARYARGMTALYETSLEINAARDLQSLLEAIVRRAAALVGGDLGNLYLVQPDGKTLELKVAPSWPPELIGLTIQVGEGLTGRAAASGKPVFVEDYRTWEGRLEAFADLPTRRALAVPLKHGERVIGVVNIADSNRTGPFSEEEVRLVSLFADQATLAIENARLYEAAQFELTERRRIEEELRESEARYRSLFNSASDAIFIADLDGAVLEVNDATVEYLGYSREELLQMAREDLCPLRLPAVLEEQLQRMQQEGSIFFETLYQRSDGSRFPVEVSSRLIDYRGRAALLCIARDVTQRKRLEEQVRQSQKMEAIGALAGGVAHDFNNLLTALQGYAEFLASSVSPEDPRYEDIRGIQVATERGSALTRQLLTFSRRQVLQPIVLNLNEVVSNMLKMLRRVIGEDVELVTFLSPDLGTVRADPSHLEQVIMNLVVNAREAMPRGGKLTIETVNFTMTEVQSRRYADVDPGPYVLLAISDTGTGIDEDKRTHIFEPFFTTKEHGTGLGLATVYGIVKQSGGHITFYSEPGRGTTFRIYLPRVDEEAQPLTESQSTAQTLQGTETIFVVEDEDMVRDLARRALEERGYTVIEARNGAEALEVSRGHAGRVDLLLTDVVMPGNMSGRELAEQLLNEFPGLKVLYMSGYTNNAIVHHGILDEGVQLLEKPFTPLSLAQKVRAVLDAPADPGA